MSHAILTCLAVASPGQAAVNPWELHPALVHLPIAFLLLAFVLDLRCKWRPSELLSRSSAGLYLLGVGTGALAAVAGGIALYTAPRMTDPGNMVWVHPALAALAMVLFTIVAIGRWKRRFLPPSAGQVGLSLAAVLLLAGAGWFGADLVYRNGFGVTPGRSLPSEPARRQDRDVP